jgi:small-conductance mechanosensitive channel
MLGDDSDLLKRLIIVAAFVVGGLGVGFVLDRVVLARFRRFAKKTTGKFDDVIYGAIRGVVVWICLLVALNFAIPYLPLAESTLSKLSTGVVVAALLVVIAVVTRLISGIAFYYANSVVPASASIVKNLINLVVLAIGILVIFQTMGINITPVITALGVGGLAVALALQDTLANLFAGVHVLAMKEINPGDYVQLDSGEEGFVEDIGWRNTTIRMLRNNLIVIPNTKLAQAIVTNCTLPQKEMSVLIPVGVAYDSDLNHVERVAKEVASKVVSEVQGGVTDFEPLIRYFEFGDSSINFNVIIRSGEFVDQYALRHEFIKALHERFKKEGIEIPFPIRTVYMADSGE